jgi:hypothetical protein
MSLRRESRTAKMTMKIERSVALEHVARAFAGVIIGI